MSNARMSDARVHAPRMSNALIEGGAAQGDNQETN